MTTSRMTSTTPTPVILPLKTVIPNVWDQASTKTGMIDELVDLLLVHHLANLCFWMYVHLVEQGRITGILYRQFGFFNDDIEEGFELGKAEAFGSPG